MGKLGKVDGTSLFRLDRNRSGDDNNLPIGYVSGRFVYRLRAQGMGRCRARASSMEDIRG